MSNVETKEKIDTLIKPMLKMKLFAVISRPLKPAEEILPFVVDHLEYMIELENKGILFASGPFVQPGVLVGAGLTILRADDINQARFYIDEEPLVKQGLRGYEIWEWELREGFLNVSIEFATGKYRFT